MNRFLQLIINLLMGLLRSLKLIPLPALSDENLVKQEDTGGQYEIAKKPEI